MVYVLYVSSVVMTLGHVACIVLSHEASFIKYVYLTGCATSILNHMNQSTNKTLRTLDRTAMVLGAANDLLYIHDSLTFGLWLASIEFYAYSKLFRFRELHVLAHVCVTLCHARVLLLNNSTVQ